MDAEVLVNRILDDEGLCAGLDEAEALVLNGWLVRQAERIAAAQGPDAEAWKHLEQLCARARVIRRLVLLHCQDDDASAAELARNEHLPWPLPDRNDPQQVLQTILKTPLV